MRATIYPALEGAFATVSTPSSSIGKPPVQEQPPPVDGERAAAWSSAWSSPSERGDHTSATTTHQPRTKSSTLGAWTRSALRDLVYAGAVFVWSIVAFTILVIGVSVTASLLVLIVGIFVWIGFAYVQRWTTWVDRQLAGWQRHEPIHAVYRRPTAPGSCRS